MHTGGAVSQQHVLWTRLLAHCAGSRWGGDDDDNDEDNDGNSSRVAAAAAAAAAAKRAAAERNAAIARQLKEQLTAILLEVTDRMFGARHLAASSDAVLPALPGYPCAHVCV
jgi:hypothetical protein